MKKLFLLSLLALSVTGCDKHTESASFTPIFANNSNIFGFDALQGPIKSFTQRMIGQDGTTVAAYSAELDQRGCFTSLDFNFPTLGSMGKNLVKVAGFYVDSKTNKKEFAIDNECNIIKSFGSSTAFENDAANSPVVYKRNDKGFIIESDVEFTNKVIDKYEYTSNGFPSMQERVKSLYTMKMVSHYSQQDKNPFNFTSESFHDGKLALSMTRECKTDSYGNPVSCEFDVRKVDGSVDSYTITNNIEYF